MTGKTKEIIMYLLKQDDNTVFELNIYEEKKKRSLNANGMLWKIADEIAKEISKDGTIITKETIYKDAVKNVGVFTPIIVEEKAFDSFKKEWESKGLGAQISEVLHKDKCVKCNCYYGSSTYNSKEFSRLVDFIVQEAQQLGIETKSAGEIKSLYEMEQKKMKSIIQKDKSKCFICGAKATEEHHCIYGTANRKLSENDGLKIYLCHLCHNEPPLGVHYNRDTDLLIKKIAEMTWLKYYHKNIEDFIKKYGRNYL